MRVLKIVLPYSYDYCLLDENRYQKLGEVVYCGIADMKSNKMEQFQCASLSEKWI